MFRFIEHEIFSYIIIKTPQNGFCKLAEEHSDARYHIFVANDAFMDKIFFFYKRKNFRHLHKKSRGEFFAF